MRICTEKMRALNHHYGRFENFDSHLDKALVLTLAYDICHSLVPADVISSAFATGEQECWRRGGTRPWARLFSPTSEASVDRV